MATSPLVIEHLAHPPVKADLQQVLSLAKKHSGTLGFLPDTAFKDRIHRGTLLVARVDGEVVGYCLYDLPRAGHIKLVHVCVGESARGSSAGRLMIDAAVAANPNAIGVLAYCRDDYDLDQFWTAAGLSPRSERPGRADSGSTLIRWWRPLGDLDLLEEATLSSGFPIVVFDTNVVSDLYASDPSTRHDHVASSGLRAGWLEAAITRAVSTRVDVELNRIEDRAERRLQRDRSSELLRLRSADDSSIHVELIQLVGQDAITGDRSLPDDLLHVADAVSAGASFFITNDEKLLRAADSFAETHPTLRLVRPHELVAEMLSRLQLPTFQSSLIESVDLEWTPAANHPIEGLVNDFLAHEHGERARDFQRTLRASLSTRPQATRVLVSPDGRRWALLSEHRVDDELSVDVLRTIRGQASGTVASQLARHVRTIARDTGLDRVRVMDKNITASTDASLRADGFVDDQGLAADLIDAAITCEEFAGIKPDVPVKTSPEVRAAERTFWPLVLIDSDIPTYVIPIQPRFAERLFAWNRSPLWGDRNRGLGLSREHVYYSGAMGRLPAGSRILWYVTKDETGTFRQIMAYSRCLGSERDVPEAVHSRNSAVGVFRLEDVRNVRAKDGLVSVVRFEDTELLKKPIGNGALRDLLTRFGVTGNIRSFRSVSPSLFDAIVEREREGIP